MNGGTLAVHYHLLNFGIDAYCFVRCTNKLALVLEQQRLVALIFALVFFLYWLICNVAMNGFAAPLEQ